MKIFAIFFVISSLFFSHTYANEYEEAEKRFQGGEASADVLVLIHAGLTSDSGALDNCKNFSLASKVFAQMNQQKNAELYANISRFCLTLKTSNQDIISKEQESLKIYDVENYKGNISALFYIGKLFLRKKDEQGVQVMQNILKMENQRLKERDFHKKDVDGNPLSDEKKEKVTLDIHGLVYQDLAEYYLSVGNNKEYALNSIQYFRAYERYELFYGEFFNWLISLNNEEQEEILNFVGEKAPSEYFNFIRLIRDVPKLSEKIENEDNFSALQKDIVDILEYYETYKESIILGFQGDGFIKTFIAPILNNIAKSSLEKKWSVGDNFEKTFKKVGGDYTGYEFLKEKEKTLFSNQINNPDQTSTGSIQILEENQKSPAIIYYIIGVGLLFLTGVGMFLIQKRNKRLAGRNIQ